jgi:cytochrome c oxidase subunit 2
MKNSSLLPGLLSWIIVALTLSACSQAASAASRSPEVQRGEAVFSQHGCSGCHAITDETRAGPGLKGVMAGDGPRGDRLPDGSSRTEANVAAWIREGAAASGSSMPPYPALSEDDLQALVAYLKSLR